MSKVKEVKFSSLSPTEDAEVQHIKESIYKIIHGKIILKYLPNIRVGKRTLFTKKYFEKQISLLQKLFVIHNVDPENVL